MEYGKFFRQHWAGLAGAFLAGLIMVSPQIVFRVAMGPEFQGTYIGGGGGGRYYVRISEVYSGNWKIASPALAEYKDFPFTLTPLPEWTVAGIGRALALTPAETI